MQRHRPCFLPRHPLVRAITASTMLVCSTTIFADDNPGDKVTRLPPIEVIGTTPLPGLGTALKDVPANVQRYRAEDLAKQRPGDIADFLTQDSAGVGANSAQGNPFQTDIHFRGFAASPLIGTPQGLSVFQDGVRVNEPFGDVVNWDLIPPSAIAAVQLIPGSNPIFGLNTLGGALAIYTKNGADYPGGAVEVSGGSFGRRTAEFELGDRDGEFDYFVTGNFFDEDGWADHNPSTVRQLFGKLGWRDAKSIFELSLTSADNELQGTQTIPRSFFDNVKQAYTFPDSNANKLDFLTARGSRLLDERALLSGTVYYRKYDNRNVSSNVNDRFGEVDPGTGLIDTVQATNDRLTIAQESYGLGLQLAVPGKITDREHQLTVGMSGDFGRARLTRESQDAQFTPQRDTVGLGGFELNTDARTANAYYGLYFTDTLALDPQWSLTVAGRYNLAQVRIKDLTGDTPELDGEHRFARFNPALGINFNPTPRLTTYASYNEGMRAPTPVELTCADPNAPCKLPNDFLADPPLKKIVAKTFEVGARGKAGASGNWSAAAYRGDLDDDIQFISSLGASNAGFFANVGQTRRQGIELSGDTRIERWRLAARYSYVDARFRSNFAEASPNNSSADANGNIQVRSGDRIPGIPQQLLKLRLAYERSGQWSAGANIIVSSGVFARGDENNRDDNGEIPGYSIVNLNTRWQAAPRWEWFARIDNLFNRRYSNFGTLGENFFTGPNHRFGPDSGIDPQAEQFRGVGAPRGIWVGLRYGFGAGGSKAHDAD